MNSSVDAPGFAAIADPKPPHRVVRSWAAKTSMQLVLEAVSKNRMSKESAQFTHAA
jgi:hypothetical protein